MRYEAHNEKTDELIYAHSWHELVDLIRYEFPNWLDDDYCTYKRYRCRGKECQDIPYEKWAEERHDYYGISTGYFCRDCYNSCYPYRKDRYPTEEHDGYGERLDEDY